MNSFKQIQTIGTRFLFITCLGMLIFISSSCEIEDPPVEGCTDISAENYDENAEVDDGTCILPRNKFLGTYSVNETCGTDSYSYSMRISPLSSIVNGIIIENFARLGVDLETFVGDKSFLIDYRDANYTITGEGNLDDDNLTINYQVINATNSFNCTMLCNK